MFLKNDGIKLGDYGLGYDISQKQNDAYYMVNYLAPEVLNKDKTQYFCKSDVW